MKKWYNVDKNGCIEFNTYLPKNDREKYEALKENISSLLKTDNHHENITRYKKFKIVHSGVFHQYRDPITKDIKSKEKIYIYDENDGIHYTNTSIFLAKQIVEKLNSEGINAYIGDAAPIINNGNITEINKSEYVGIYIEKILDNTLNQDMPRKK